MQRDKRMNPRPMTEPLIELEEPSDNARVVYSADTFIKKICARESMTYPAWF